MREAIGGTWLFQIVIFFVLLFTGYMCLTINHSKAFNIKNNIINAIEREEGINLQNPENDPAIKNIVEYLKSNSYRTTGVCPNDVKDKNGNIVTKYYGYNRDGKLDSRNSAFCIAEQVVRKNNQYGDTSSNYNEFPNMRYYRIVVFYQLDLPIFKSIFEFKVSGDTKVISSSLGVVS